MNIVSTLCDEDAGELEKKGALVGQRGGQEKQETKNRNLGRGKIKVEMFCCCDPWSYSVLFIKSYPILRTISALGNEE